MIKLQVIGHLGKDALVNTVNSKTVINFNVAHTEKFTSNGEKKERTTWVNCAYWTDKTAVAPYLKKGVQVYVEGTPDVRQWESNNGSGVSLECRVVNVQLLGGGQPGGTIQQSAPTQQTIQQQPTKETQQDYTEVADDLPF